MIFVYCQGKPFNITIIEALTSNDGEAEWFCEDLQDLLELTAKKDVLIIIADWNTKVLEFRRYVKKQASLALEYKMKQGKTTLPRERTGHSKHSLPTTKEKTLHMNITRWSIPKSDLLYSLQAKMENLYTVSRSKISESWLWLRSWTPYCQIQTEIKESGENH